MRLRLFTVDLAQQLWIVRGIAGEQSSKSVILACLRRDCVRHAINVLKRVAAQVLQLELEAAKAADTLNGGRLEGDDDATRNHHQLAAQIEPRFLPRSVPCLSGHRSGFRFAKMMP